MMCLHSLEAILLHKDEVMRKYHFLRRLLIVGGSLMFFKIYQCNKFIKTIYEKQRIDRLTNDSIKKINELHVSIAKLQHYQKITLWASTSLGMQPTTPNRFFSFVKGHGDLS